MCKLLYIIQASFTCYWGGQCSIPDECLWYFCRTEWHWDRFLSGTAGFPCQFHSTKPTYSFHLNTTVVRRTSGTNIRTFKAMLIRISTRTGYRGTQNSFQLEVSSFKHINTCIFSTVLDKQHVSQWPTTGWATGTWLRVEGSFFLIFDKASRLRKSRPY